MRLDHLLSKEEEVGVLDTAESFGKSVEKDKEASGADALRGNTRTHPEHDG